MQQRDYVENLLSLLIKQLAVIGEAKQWQTWAKLKLIELNKKDKIN